MFPVNRTSDWKKPSLRMVAAGSPWRVRPHIDSSSKHVLEFHLSLTEKIKKATSIGR